MARVGTHASHTATILLLIGSFAAVGCTEDNGGVDPCTTNADCSSGFLCVDRSCIDPNARPDAGGEPPGCRRDTDCRAPRICVNDRCGDPPRMDAGGLRDVGVPDTGGPDTGGPDTGRPDGGLVESGTRSDGGICGLLACVAQGASCDSVLDDCGEEQPCGSCENGQRCEDNQCVDVCTPALCDGRCGSIGNGCDCGGCGSGQRCENNRCVASCIRASCNRRCGWIDDGCGGMRDCAGCSSGLRCGVGGPTHCGCTNQPRQTDFEVFRSAVAVDYPSSAATDRPWSYPGYAQQFDQNGANVHLWDEANTSNYLWMYNADINVPHDATITGLAVIFDAKLHPEHAVSPSLIDQFFFSQGHFQTRAVGPDNGFVLSPTSWRRFPSGAWNNLWGTAPGTITPAGVNNPEFGLRLRMRCYNCTAPGQTSRPLVDAAMVRVFYTVCR